MSGGPTGTRTRTEEPGLGELAVSSILARTRALRVVGSTRASSATILAEIGGESLVAKTSTLSPLAQARGHLLRDREVRVRGVVNALQGREQRAFL